MRNLIERHGPCVGFSLFKFKSLTIHLWYCPKNYKIEKHSHEDQSIELLFLFGCAEFSKIENGKTKSIKVSGLAKSFKTFTICPGIVHWFSVSKRPLIFINIATWKPGVVPTSAAIDFHEVKKEEGILK